MALDSYQNDCLVGVAAGILGIPGKPDWVTVETVKRRKRPVFVPKDPEKIIAVWPEEDDESPDHRRTFAGDAGKRTGSTGPQQIIQMAYWVGIAVLEQGELRYGADPAEILFLREKIRQRFLKPKPITTGSGSVFVCDRFKLGKIYEYGSMNAGYDESKLLFRFVSAETLNG